MHVVSESTRGSARLSVYFEQDLFDNDDDSIDRSKKERVDIRRIADDSLLEISAVDSNNNDSSKLNESIESNELNGSSEHNDSNVTPPPPVMRRHKGNGRSHSRSRERSFVHAASGAVVDGARTVARTFKRMSLIESSSSSSNIRERAAQESNAQDGVDQLKPNAKHKQQYNSTPSLPTSGAPLQPSGSVHSLGSSSSHSQSPRSSQSHSHSQSQSQGKGSSGSTAGNKGGNTAKQHDQQTSAVAAISSTSAAAGVGAAQVAAATPPEKEKDKDKEKEKKRKEVSSSRVKKFHRHFSQVSKDEKLINYFSCALVGDIPLQGHLYITEDHFAFYSNVFGYVTKVVIPTTSVTKISKEKTAKIIPNAVGVATADERHVFGSFISREAAFRLMCTVCTQLATGSEILPKPLPVDVELTEEYLNDDDSSCSISGNESPPHLRSTAVAAGGASEPETMLRQRSLSDRHSDLQGKSALAVDNGISLVGQMIARSSAPPVVYYEAETQALLGAGAGGGGGGSCQSASHSTSASSSGPTSSSSSPITVVGMGLNVSVGVATTTTTTIAATRHNTIGSRLSSMRSRLRQQLPTLTELHVLYLGIMLAIMLALFSVFLLYRILDIEAKTHLYNTPVDFNLRSGNDEDLFAEALRWQKELQDKSTAEAQHILSKNLEQISKVRRSLETLSMLIHDRRAGYAQPETEMETQMDMDMEGTGGLESEPLPNDHVASSFPDFND
ncbi:hypothetical protein ACLKA7_007008 [Drosophila subpalustris]